ncbi:MAG: DUF5103 domain-containing protein [Bacteroidia bacterium]|nr:DUF5103 domain-containing protein [Bacteroidia bacterium]MDW8348238.1 DUF5103 domain-containing protein [Bacteroidia bacterium]
MNLCRKILLVVLLISIQPLFAQKKKKNTPNNPQNNSHTIKKIQYKDATYENNVKTVQLYQDNQQLTYPILFLNQPGQLTLEFDVLNGTAENFYVTVVHCTHDWEDSGLIPNEYLTSLNNDIIVNFRSSLNTLTPYIHYQYRFPNENLGIKLPGNYLLKVFRNQDEDDIILTRRFLVSDQTVFVNGIINIATSASIRNQAHQIDMSIGFSRIRKKMMFPVQDLKVKIMQNHRWDRMMEVTHPTIISDTSFIYDGFASNLTFDAINEFRRADVRSITQYSNQVRKVYQQDSMFYTVLFTDMPRSRQKFVTFIDFNGLFYIDVQGRKGDPDIACEYQTVIFTLNSEPIPDSEVYVVGAFTDWQLRPENKMQYDEITQVYQSKILLKQGIYDYLYVVKSIKDNNVNHTLLENNYSECQNFYTVLVYYRPIGGRADFLSAVQMLRFGR